MNDELLDMVIDRQFYAIGFIIFLVLSSCADTPVTKVTLLSLVHEMTSHESLTYYPAKPYRHLQFSSYNRESVIPGTEGWFANEDMSHFIRVEQNHGRREFVMFDTSGPGAIVRWWMTFYLAQEGRIRVYLDHDTTPVIQGRPDQVLSGDLLALPPFALSVHQGVIIREKGRDLDHNLYIPIPFARHCKITYECDSLRMYKKDFYYPDVFYNIGYRRYDDDVEVETFSMQALAKAKSLLDKAGDILLNETIHSEMDKEFNTEILPGDSFSVNFNQKGSAVNRLILSICSPEGGQALRSTVLSANFDGMQTVWVPVGEFFGTGYRPLAHRTWVSLTNKKGQMESRWLMPYRDSCRLTLINCGRLPVKISGRAGISSYQWKPNSMYFGASWHEYYRLNTRNETGGRLDLNYIDIKGKGVYAGDQVTLFNTSYEWWGEGDEKIFVDGEAFPSSFGTGSEDYYGYGFGRRDPFSHPFISQPVGDGNEGNTNDGGLTVNMRYRSLDALPFARSISSNIELWHWAETRMNYALTSYWYVQPPFDINIIPDTAGVRRPVAISSHDIYSH